MRPRSNFRLIICLFFIFGILSCYHSNYRYNDNDVSVSINETDDVYRMSASFDEGKTRLVRNYISDHTGNNGLFRSGGNIEMDASTTYGDNINIDIKFRPGHLKIKLDKDENSEEAYNEVKDMCEGIKDLLTDQ